MWSTGRRTSGRPEPARADVARDADAALGRDDAERFLGHLRAENEAGRGIDRYAVAFLWAVKR